MPELEDKWNEAIRRAETTDALFCIFKKRGGKVQFFASNESQPSNYQANTDGFILSSFEDNELKMITKNLSFDFDSAEDVALFDSYINRRQKLNLTSKTDSYTSAETYARSFDAVMKKLCSKENFWAICVFLTARTPQIWRPSKCLFLPRFCSRWFNTSVHPPYPLLRLAMRFA